MDEDLCLDTYTRPFTTATIDERHLNNVFAQSTLLSMHPKSRIHFPVTAASFFFPPGFICQGAARPCLTRVLVFAVFIYLLIYLFPLNMGVGKPSDESEGARHRELVFVFATAGTPHLQPVLSPLPRIMRSLSYCSLIIPAERTSERANERSSSIR